MPSSWPGSVLAAAIAGAALAFAPQPAAGDVAFRASVAPTTVSSPARLVYGLTMVNLGDGQERFSVALVSPTYGPPARGAGVAESNAVQRTALPQIDGPASVLGGYVFVSGLLAPCSVAGAGGHGYGIDGMSFDVGLPPHSTSTLSVPYEAGLAFWPDLDLRLRFVLGRILTTGKRGTLPRDRKVLTPQPAITGRVAVHLTFRTTPASGLASFAGRPPIDRGEPVVVSGSTNPPIPGLRVELRYARIGSKANVVARGLAGRPRVGARGTFRTRWTPPGPGDYELWARYVSQRPGLRSDDTCPRMLRVKR